MKHWIAVEVNFKERTVSYGEHLDLYFMKLANVAQGDSLSHEEMPRPRAVMKKLQWWLQKRFEKPFRELGDQLVHGKQENGTECGILTANTIAHMVFQDPLWVVHREEVERVQWFNRLVQVHIDKVRIHGAMIYYVKRINSN